MKEKIILLMDADADCAGIVLEAGARTGHGVRLSRDSGDALAFFNREFDRIDAVVIDVDPGTNVMVLLEAISALRRRPPVIVLADLQGNQVEAVTAWHGAAECLGKPVSIDRLKAALERIILLGTDEKVSCDAWGHPCRCGVCVEDGVCA